jgi:hypothetical protein
MAEKILTTKAFIISNPDLEMLSLFVTLRRLESHILAQTP